MKSWSILFLVFMILPAGSSAAGDAEAAIKNVLNAQVRDWNQGNLESFVASYAEDCTFVGKRLVHGRSAVLARYRTTYASRAAMGRLTFTELEVRVLDGNVAIVTGNFQLDRTAAAGGPAAGVFSLVMRLQDGRWQIVLDHTS